MYMNLNRAKMKLARGRILSYAFCFIFLYKTKSIFPPQTRYYPKQKICQEGKEQNLPNGRFCNTLSYHAAAEELGGFARLRSC